jgi:tetratricopeptide (TPR) repeat protein
MRDAEPQQVFVRNDRGRRWGPITPATLELLLENGLIEGRIQISIDGENFTWPGRLPEIRDFVPRALWGEGAPAPAMAAPAIAPLHAESPAAPAPRPPPPARAPAAAPPHIPPRAAVPPPGAAAPPPSAIAPPPSAAPPPPSAAAPEGSADPRLTPEALDRPPPAGDLSVVSPVRLYYLAASSDATGLLTLRLAQRAVEIHFRKGNPEYVGSNHPEDALAGFLLRQGLATTDQLVQAESALERFGGDLVAALFGLGILNPTTAFAHVAQRAHGILLKALLANTGQFEWTPKDLPPHKAMPLGHRWGVLMELLRRVPAAEFRQRFAPVVDHPVMKSGGRVPLSELRLTPQETRAMGYVDGVRSLALLAHDMPQDADTFFRLAWILQQMDIVSFAAVKLPPPPVAPGAPATPAAPAVPAAPRAAAPTSKPAPKPAAAAPSGPVDFAAEIKLLHQQVERRKEQNHFQLLGIDERADASAVKIAYHKLAKQYHPDTVPSNAPAELGKLKEQIFAAIGEAYRTLSDDASRQRYVEKLSEGAGEVDIAQILHAEELFQKGCILVKAKKFPDAVEMLSEAITLNPEEGEFYAWRGIARFYAAADRKKGKAEADRDLVIALKKNPRCAQAHYFQGQVAKGLGDNGGAVKQFQKALEIQPDHLDAQREIRHLLRK